MTSMWTALCLEALVLSAVVGTATSLLRARLRGEMKTGVTATVVTDTPANG